MTTPILREFVQPDSYGTPRTFCEFNCDHCGKLHARPKRNLKELNFCSNACSNLHRSPNSRVEIACAFCHATHTKRVSSLPKSRSGLYFCSRKCKDTAQRVESGFPEIQPDHYGTAARTYREVAFRNHPNRCNKCGYAEYPEVLDVHHKDRNRENNDPANLELLCPTCHRVNHFLSKTGWYAGKKVVERAEYDPA